MTEQELQAYNDLIIQFEKSDLGVWLAEKRATIRKGQITELLDAALKSSDPHVRGIATLLTSEDIWGEMDTVKALVAGRPKPDPRAKAEEYFGEYFNPL